MIDDKLKKLEVEISFREGNYTSHEEGQLTEESIDKIQQIFQDAGYVPENLSYSYKVLPANMMSGQEWYERFKKELKHLVSRGDGETWMGWDCGEVTEAAKKASEL